MTDEDRKRFQNSYNNTEPEISGEDNLHTLALIEALYRSIDEDRKVKVSEFI